MHKREPLRSWVVTGTRRPLGDVVPVSTLIGAAGCVLLVSLGAQVRVPIPGTTVPMTLQSFAVLLCGYFAARRAVLSGLLAYVALGAVGMPVFSPGSQGLAGETGGYLIGFIIGAWLIATLRGDRGAGVGRLVLAGAMGTAAIFACGIVWRSLFFGGNLGHSVTTGFVPFAGKAAVQLGVVVSMVVAARSLRRRDREGLSREVPGGEGSGGEGSGGEVRARDGDAAA